MVMTRQRQARQHGGKLGGTNDDDEYDDGDDDARNEATGRGSCEMMKLFEGSRPHK